MEFGKRLGLRVKIALPFIITAIALVVIGLFAVSTVRNLVSDTDNIADTFLPSVSEILNGDRDLYQALVAQMAYVDARLNNEEGEGHLASFDENAGQARDRFNQAVERLEGTGVSDVARGFDSAFERWLSSAQRVLELAEAGNAEQARSLAGSETNNLFDRLRNYFDEVGAHADAQAQVRAGEASSEGQSSSATILLITVAAILISILLFAVFLKMIISSIKALRDQLDNIAQGEGDLTQRIPVELDDDLGKLAQSFNLVLENLQSMIGSIQQLSRELGTGATDLARVAKDNNDGVTKQTDSIAMVATAINEMQSAIEEVAGNASRAAEITREAEDKGKNGARIIRSSSEQVHRLAAQISKAVEVIRKLSDDSNNITSVLDVIRGIAEQTNLLALNAAIEAARAGEQGRGFAVVADEARTLASRTRESTDEISTMIDGLKQDVSGAVSVIQSGVDRATSAVDGTQEAAHSLATVVDRIGTIVEHVTQVAAAAEEQSSVSEEINRNLTHIGDAANDLRELAGRVKGSGQALDNEVQVLERELSRLRT